MSPALAENLQSEPFQITDEASLADILKAREQGIDVRQLAAFFKQALTQFEKVGQNLYGRMLLEPSDAEALVDYPHEQGQRRMIILASNNYLGLTHHPRVVAAAQEAAGLYGTGSGSSPLLVGSFPVTKQLESKLARLRVPKRPAYSPPATRRTWA